MVRAQLWEFLKHIARGCFWASMIAIGMLTYTAFANKWREKGFPAIPITALVAVDQAFGQRAGPTGPMLPLSGGGQAQSQYSPNRQAERSQTSFHDMGDYEG